MMSKIVFTHILAYNKTDKRECEISMKKVLISVLLILTLFTNLACRQQPTVDAQFVSEVFLDLEIECTHLFINHVNQSSNPPIDLIEMLDQSDRDAIIIHIIDSTNNLDYQILITPEYFYDTRTMTKIENTYPNTDEGRIEAILAYTSLIDFEFLEISNLYNLAQRLVSRTYTKTRLHHTLRGELLDTNYPDNQKEFAEFVIADEQLVELHFRLEEDFQSTKKENNYVAGIHYYFSNQMPLEFPSLSQFFEE